MSTKHPLRSITSYLQSLKCELAFGRNGNFCINTFYQLDFAVTLAALIGVPFPFGSIGHVNPELLALVSGSWNSSTFQSADKDQNDYFQLKWMEHYLSVLCLNSWQVNRYLELYSGSALSGFPTADFLNVHSLYTHAQSVVVDCQSRTCQADTSEIAVGWHEKRDALADQIVGYSRYLESAAALARSKWTKFSDSMMALGLILFAASAAVHVVGLHRASMYCCAIIEKHDKDSEQLFPVKSILKRSFFVALIAAAVSVTVSTVSILITGAPSIVSPLTFNHLSITILGAFTLGSAVLYILPNRLIMGRTFDIQKAVKNLLKWNVRELVSRPTLAFLSVALHACSLLSNSYILAEGQVVTFLLASFGLMNLRHALQAKSKIFQVLCFLGLNCTLGSISRMGIFKETPSAVDVLNQNPIWQLASTSITALLPFSILLWFVSQQLWRSHLWQKNGFWIINIGMLLSSIFVLLHWLLEDLALTEVVIFSEAVREFARLQLPRLVYFITTVETLILVFCMTLIGGRSKNCQIKDVLGEAAIRLLAVWSSLILLLLGRYGPLIALLAVIQGGCLFNMQSICLPHAVAPAPKNSPWQHTAPTVQWSLFALQLFFCTGHKCTFDGLRFAAAFIGFDHFNFYRQGALLAVDTFGASHILPIIGIPLMVSCRPWLLTALDKPSDKFYKWEMSQAFLLYGMARAATAIMTTVCVTIQRRHLMVWGLFAPKFVFDAIGLLVTDALLLLVALYSLLPFLIY